MKPAPWKKIKTLPVLKPQEVHLWHVPLRFEANQPIPFQKILSEDEKAKAQRFYFEKLRHYSAYGRGVLRILLGHYLQKKPETLTFRYNQYDKPFLKKDELHFNISHTQDQALMGFCSSDLIGVDLEWIKKERDILDIADHYFTPPELKLIHELQDPYQTFYQLWTLKEAFIKARGMGLSIPLQSFAVTWQAQTKHKEKISLQTQPKLADWSQYFFKMFFVTPEIPGAMALRFRPKKIHYYDWQAFAASPLAFPAEIR